MSTTTTTRKTAGQRTGYAVAAMLDAVLLVFLNGWPGWDAVPFLTGDMSMVLPWINVSLVVGLVVNVAYLVHPAPWLVAAGGIATTGVGLAVIGVLWRVFPFDFGAGSAWTAMARVLLVVAFVGSLIGIGVQIRALTGAVRGGRR